MLTGSIRLLLKLVCPSLTLASYYELTLAEATDASEVKDPAKPAETEPKDRAL